MALAADQGDAHSAAACSSDAAAYSSGVALASDQGDAHSAAVCSSGPAARSSGVALASDQGDARSAAACSSGAAAHSSGAALAADQDDAHSAAACFRFRLVISRKLPRASQKNVLASPPERLLGRCQQVNLEHQVSCY